MQALALDVHGLLRDLDPARARLESAGDRLAAIVAAIEELPATAHQLWRDFAELARAHAPATAEQWEAFRLAAQPVYEAIAQQLGELDIHVPSLRPTNYVRNGFHVFGAVLAIGLIETVLPLSWLLPVAGAVAVFGWTWEATRRLIPSLNTVTMKLFALVAHPHEAHRVNSSTWYATALVCLAATGRIELCVMAIAVLGIADPAAAIVGRRFGKTKLVNGRSLEGSLTFFVVGTLAALAAGLLHLPLWTALAAALGASALGAVTELYSRKIDDNFSIPLASASGAWLMLLAVGALA